MLNKRQSQQLPQMLLALLVVAYICTFTYLTFLRFDAFEARSLDLGNFDQAIWNTAHGRWFHLTNQPGIVNRLSLHVEPILIPISSLYWIYSSPKTLLLLQAAIVAMGALPLYALAKKVLENGWLALLISLAYLLNPSIQAANWLEFHAVTLAPTFLIAAFYYLWMGKNRRFVLFAILAASCKEEIGLLVFMMGFYAVVMLRRYRLGGITMLVSASWALFAVLGIQDYYGSGNIHWGRYGYLGGSPLQIVGTLLTDPQLVLNQLQKADVLLYIGRLLIPTALIGLLAPEIFLLAAPSLAINLLADFAPMHQIDTLIYAVPIVPFALIAGIFGLRRLLGMARNLRTRQFMMVVVGVLILGANLVNHLAYGYTPGSGNYLPLEITDHHRQGSAIIKQIPPDAKVSAQDRLNPHVSQRETVYIYPRVEDTITGNADTIFIDVTGPAFPLHPNDLYREILGWVDEGFGVAAAQDGYLLLRRGAPSADIPTSFYTPWQVKIKEEEATKQFQPLEITFGDSSKELMQLTSVHVTTDRYGELVTELTWHLLAEHSRDLSFYIAYLDRDGQPLHTTEFYPLPASLWYPTSLWKIRNEEKKDGVSIHGDHYKVRTLPWTLDVEQFTLAVGLFYTDSGPEWSSSERLNVTHLGTPRPLWEGNTLVRLGGYTYQPNKFLGWNRAGGRWDPLPLPLPPTNRIEARFGEQLLLRGITLHTPQVAAGDQVSIELSWDAVGTIDKDYSLFVRLISESGEEVAQLDRQPADQAGFLPMTSWPADWSVVDKVMLDVDPTTPAGHYRLLAGLYFWQDGRRLPVSGPRATPDNAIELGWIEITR